MTNTDFTTPYPGMQSRVGLLGHNGVNLRIEKTIADVRNVLVEQKYLLCRLARHRDGRAKSGATQSEIIEFSVFFGRISFFVPLLSDVG